MKLRKIKGILLAAVVAVGVVKSGEFTFATDEKDFKYVEDKKNGGIKITEYTGGTLETLIIPESIDGKTVTSIDKEVFSNCWVLRSVKLNDGLVEIGNEAFADCFELEDVEFNDGLQKIGYMAFCNCNKLEKIELNDGLLEIGNNAFEFTGIKSIEIPESVKRLGGQVFCRCTKLENIVINGPIGEKAEYDSWAKSTFEDDVLNDFLICQSLKSINVKDYDSNYLSTKDGVLFNKDGSTLIKYPAKHKDTKYVIPDGVETISNYAFGYSYDLTEVTIPDSVTSIGMNAFIDCKSLKSVTIPESVTSIGDSALGCEVRFEQVEDGDDEYIEWAYITGVDGFTIKGKKDSAAYKYAMDYKFIFVDIDTGETIIPEYDDEEEITSDVTDDVMTMENATATVNPASGSTDGRAFMMVFAVMAVAAGASVFTLKMRRE